MTDSVSIQTVLDAERDYQDSFSNTWFHEGKPPVVAEILMIEEYFAEATTKDTDEARLDMLRKIASMCLRSFENWGLPQALEQGRDLELRGLRRSLVYDRLSSQYFDVTGCEAVTDYMNLMGQHILAARRDWTRGAGFPARNRALWNLYQVLGVAVACFSRYGVPARVARA